MEQNNTELSRKIEAVLFWKAAPISKKDLGKLLKTDDQALTNGITALRQQLGNRGLTVLETDDEISLGTAKDLSDLINQLAKEELTKDLGKAGLETISIILYQNPISRAEIDYIRGVNSQFILRALLIRGLIERVDNPKDSRGFLYKPTIQLLSFMGISNIQDLPDYEKVRTDIQSYKSTPVDGGQ